MIRHARNFLGKLCLYLVGARPIKSAIQNRRKDRESKNHTDSVHLRNFFEIQKRHQKYTQGHLVQNFAIKKNSRLIHFIAQKFQCVSLSPQPSITKKARVCKTCCHYQHLRTFSIAWLEIMKFWLHNCCGLFSEDLFRSLLYFCCCTTFSPKSRQRMHL